MLTIEGSVELVRPMEDVFAFVTDITNMPRWMNDLVASAWTYGAYTVGSRFESQYRQGNQTHSVYSLVTAYDAPTTFGVHSRVGAHKYPFDSLVTFEETSRGTRVTHRLEAGAESSASRLLFLLFGPVLRLMMRRQMAREFKTLKAILEAEIPSRPTPTPR